MILCAGAAAYANALAGPFVFDDSLSIVENLQIRRVWTPAVLFPARELPVAGRPIVNLSFAINYAVGGLDVRGYHVWNIATILLCGLVLFGIVRRTLELEGLKSRFGRNAANLAFASGLIWVLHPLNTEAVDYVTQRTESMMGLFYFVTIYASIRARGRHRNLWEAMAVTACAIGMGCKESMVTAPIMVVIYDRVFVFESMRQALRERARFYTALAATWGVLAGLMWSGPRVHSAGFATNVGPWEYLLNQSVMILQYLHLSVWPGLLVINYGRPRAMTLSDVAPQAFIVTLLLLLTVVMLVKRPKLGFLGVWFFITLAPASSIVPIATEVGAERRMYLPLAALIVLGVIAIQLAWDRLRGTRPQAVTGGRERWASAAAWLLLAVVASACAEGTRLRNRDYASALALARTVLERRPSDIAHLMVGTELILAGDPGAAVPHLRQASQSEPRAYYSLGMEFFKERRLDEAIDNLQQFVAREPLLLEVVSARTTLGRAFSMQKKWKLASEQFRLVLAMRPTDIEAHGLIATALFMQRSFDEANSRYVQYLTYRPNDTAALTNLGIGLAAAGKGSEAVNVFRRAVDLSPQSGDYRRNLANALLDQNRFEEAAQQAQRAVAMTPQDPVAHELLGLALAAQGMLVEAKAQLELSLRLDPTYLEARGELNQVLSRIKSRGGM